jgi:membrane protein implicated in regulation of membrane protease activity
VAHTYAGILGPLALLTSFAHGAIHSHQCESMLLAGWLSLVSFAVVGGVLGWLAERTVEDSVQSQVETELAAEADSPTDRGLDSPV